MKGNRQKGEGVAPELEKFQVSRLPAEPVVKRHEEPQPQPPVVVVDEPMFGSDYLDRWIKEFGQQDAAVAED